MEFKDKYIHLKDKDIDLLLLRFLTIYANYDVAEALILIILSTEMGET